MTLEILSENSFNFLKKGTGTQIHILKEWIEIVKLQDSDCNRRGVARDDDGTYYFVAWNDKHKKNKLMGDLLENI